MTVFQDTNDELWSELQHQEDHISRLTEHVTMLCEENTQLLRSPVTRKPLSPKKMDSNTTAILSNMSPSVASSFLICDPHPTQEQQTAIRDALVSPTTCSWSDATEIYLGDTLRKQKKMQQEQRQQRQQEQHEQQQQQPQRLAQSSPRKKALATPRRANKPPQAEPSFNTTMGNATIAMLDDRIELLQQTLTPQKQSEASMDPADETLAAINRVIEDAMSPSEDASLVDLHRKLDARIDQFDFSID